MISILNAVYVSPPLTLCMSLPNNNQEVINMLRTCCFYQLQCVGPWITGCYQTTTRKRSICREHVVSTSLVCWSMPPWITGCYRRDSISSLAYKFSRFLVANVNVELELINFFDGTRANNNSTSLASSHGSRPLEFHIWVLGASV